MSLLALTVGGVALASIVLAGCYIVAMGLEDFRYKGRNRA